MNKMSKIIAVVIAVIVVGGGSFYGGMVYGQNNAQAAGRSAAGQFFQRNGTAGGLRNRTGGAGGFSTGQIISVDATSITIKMQDGGSKIVFYSPTTTIGKTAAGTSADLTVGTNVVANGTANSDGSITATSIQIRPAGQQPPALQNQ